ncbi:hypothetical protein MTO96_045891 [Rhipicephalus appendiculatus]
MEGGPYVTLGEITARLLARRTGVLYAFLAIGRSFEREMFLRELPHDYLPSPCAGSPGLASPPGALVADRDRSRSLQRARTT